MRAFCTWVGTNKLSGHFSARKPSQSRYPHPKRMRPLSAADCFTPALERAKAILLPFNWRLWIKLGLVAVLAEIGAQFMFPPTGGGHSSNSSSGPSLLAL